jgi:hypothetical protein
MRCRKETTFMPDNYGKNTDDHTQYVIITDFLRKNSYAKGSQYHRIHTMPALYNTTPAQEVWYGATSVYNETFYLM